MGSWQNKMPAINPHHPQIMIKDETAQKPNRAIFPSLILGERGKNFPSILSKIIGPKI